MYTQIFAVLYLVTSTLPIAASAGPHAHKIRSVRRRHHERIRAVVANCDDDSPSATVTTCTSGALKCVGSELRRE